MKKEYLSLFLSRSLSLLSLCCFGGNSARRFCKKGFLVKFPNFTGKHLFQKIFLLWHRYFPINFANFLRTLFFIEHLWWLLLSLSLLLKYLGKFIGIYMGGDSREGRMWQSKIHWRISSTLWEILQIKHQS